MSGPVRTAIVRLCGRWRLRIWAALAVTLGVALGGLVRDVRAIHVPCLVTRRRYPR